MDQGKQKPAHIINGIMNVVNSALLITDKDCNILFKNKACDGLLASIGKNTLRSNMQELYSQLEDKQQVLSQQLNFLDVSVALQCTLSSIEGQNLLAWSLVELSPSEDSLASQHTCKMASIGDMAVAIVHEIRNPLTVITGQISLAQEYYERDQISSEFLEKLIKRIDKSSGRISAIIKSLLNLSRRTDQESMSTHLVSDILEEVDLFASLKVKGVKVPYSIEFPDQMIKVRCHPSEITQVLINLIKNAREEVHGQKDSWVRLTVDCKADKIQFLVTDSGHGIPDEIASQIFAPYFTTKGIGQGTGVGLALCKRLIEDHHKGRLYLNKECSNTQFVLEIPLDPKA